MNGHQQLLEMRRAGKKPHSVWITDSDDHYSRETARDWAVRPDMLTGVLYAHIRVERADIPEELDFTCIAGLEVHVASDRGDARFLRLFQAVSDAGAAAVAGLSEGQVHVFKPTTTENA